MMYLVECHLSIVPWGKRARFSKVKLGLVRQGAHVYLGVFSQNKSLKFIIQQGSMEVLPSAIRLTEMQSDIFIGRVYDVKPLEDIMRAVKVLLRRDSIRRNGKGDRLDKLIAEIPHLDSIKRKDMIPATRAVRIGRYEVGPQANTSSVRNVLGECDDSDAIGLNERELNYYNLVKRPKLEKIRCLKVVGLQELPDRLWLADSLIELQLIDCNLSSIPKQLENLADTLQTLDLSRNTIEKLPRTFCCKMNRLSFLDLSHNKIVTLPLEIKFLQGLKEFNLSNNRLKMIPTTLSDLSGLRVLRVCNNKLSQLPAFRRQDIRLRILDISGNPLDGALKSQFSTFEVHSSYNDDEYNPFTLSFMSSLYVTPSPRAKQVPSLFEISILNIVRSDNLFKLASEEKLPRTIVSTIQRDIFKCYRCNKMNILPAYNSTDTLDYLDQVETLISSNYCSSMTFMKLICRNCFSYMAS